MATIVKRLELERPLTNAEVDANFENLNTEKIERDGSIPMTGDLSTPGIKSVSSANGLKVYNENDELVATFGEGNNKNVTFEGSISVGGSGDLSVDGGSITVNDLIVTGRIITDQLRNQYNVSADGEVFSGVGNTSGSQLIVTVNTVLTIESVTGDFVPGNIVTGGTSGATGTIIKYVGNLLYVDLTNAANVFQVGESVIHAGNSGTITKVATAESFKEGSKVKIYGVSPEGTPDVSDPGTVSVSKIGTGSGFNYHYWVAIYKYDDGNISRARKISTVINHVNPANFNAENNILFQLSRPNNEYGFLIYRSNTNDISTAKLIDILGPAELGQGATAFYTDYGGYSKTEWSTKNDIGEYTEDSQLIHFPLTANDTVRKGWVYEEVDNVNDAKTITLKLNYQLNVDGLVEIVHDNTDAIQSIIDDNIELGVNSLVFPAGTYYTRKLSIPSNFILAGESKSAILKQLPWNLDEWNSTQKPQEKGSMLVPKTSFSENISFRTLTFNGNFVNNVKYDISRSNYLLNFSNIVNLTADNISVQNTAGGGIWVYQGEKIRIQNSEILNGGLSYVGNTLSPLYASEASFLIANNNYFENFVSPVDASVTTISSIVGNTIRNCGSGLLVFGSKNLLSSPNLIMGPDNEFIPGPDTLDTDYNAINITVEPGIEYNSTKYLYVENNESVYLGSDDKDEVPGTGVSLDVDIKLLTKINNVEQLKADYTLNDNDQPRITISTPETGDFSREQGYFSFKITESNATAMPTLSDLIEENTNLVSGEQIMGLVYRVKATTYTFTDVGNRILIENSESFIQTGSDKFATIVIQDANLFPYFAVGDTVKIFGHDSTPSINNEDCEVVEKIETGLLRKLKIKLPAAINISGAVSGTDAGYITIRKTFIIAKGRIN